jgi:diguanylate cyclase (GGDEF)-like protein
VQAVPAVIDKRYLHADGHVVWVKASIAVIRSPDGHPLYAVTQVDNITDRRAETERLSAKAWQDPLTGMGNRLLFDERMAQAVTRAVHTRRPLGVIFCDLDRFKTVNDTYGHAAGDTVLRAVATRIRDTVRAGDTVARLGGDEFAVLCEDLETPAGCEPVIERLQTTLNQPDPPAQRHRDPDPLQPRARHRDRQRRRHRHRPPAARGGHRDVPEQERHRAQEHRQPCVAGSAWPILTYDLSPHLGNSRVTGGQAGVCGQVPSGWGMRCRRG